MKDYKPYPPEYLDPPVCPVCGSSFYRDIYKSRDGVVGCDDCVDWLTAEEWWEELELEREEEEYDWEEDRKEDWEDE